MDVDEVVEIVDEPCGSEAAEGNEGVAETEKASGGDQEETGGEEAGTRTESGDQGESGTIRRCSVALERIVVESETSTDADTGSGSKLVEKTERKIVEIVDKVPLSVGERARKAARKAKIYVDRLGAELGDREVRVGELVRELREMKGGLKELKRRAKAQAKIEKGLEEATRNRDQGIDEDCLEVVIDEGVLGETEGDQGKDGEDDQEQTGDEEEGNWKRSKSGERGEARAQGDVFSRLGEREDTGKGSEGEESAEGRTGSDEAGSGSGERKTRHKWTKRVVIYGLDSDLKEEEVGLELWKNCEGISKREFMRLFSRPPIELACRDPRTRNWVVEVPRFAAINWVEDGGVWVRGSKRSVRAYVEIDQCAKCWEVGHKAGSCNREQAWCKWCGGAHWSRDCDREGPLRCVVCARREVSVGLLGHSPKGMNCPFYAEASRRAK